MALGYEPAGEYIALTFLEDDERDENDGSAPASCCDDTTLAVVEGVGNKVTVCKTGDTVLVRSYARNGIKLGNATLVESYCVVARIKK